MSRYVAVLLLSCVVFCYGSANATGVVGVDLPTPSQEEIANGIAEDPVIAEQRKHEQEEYEQKRNAEMMQKQIDERKKHRRKHGWHKFSQ